MTVAQAPRTHVEGGARPLRTGGAGNRRGLAPPGGLGVVVVASRAAEGGVELPFVERLLQRLGLHHLGMERRAGIEGIDAAPDAVLIDVFDEIQAQPLHGLIAEFDHLGHLVGGVDVDEWKRHVAEEGLPRQPQHGILA